MYNLIISIILSLLLGALAFYKKAMTNSALILAIVLAFLITYFGGLCAYLILVAVFLGTVVANKIKKSERIKVNKNIIEKSGKKDIVEIIANVVTGAVFIILYKITKVNIYFLVYASIMAESLADSLASDIGVLSKKSPINILTLKKSEPGLSGNISALGLASSFFGSLIIAIIFSIFNFQTSSLIIITLSGFLGAIFDSILGATIQVKYKCQKCSKIVEKKIHCEKETIYYKGIKIINNDTVNLISNVFAAIIATTIYLIIL